MKMKKLSIIGIGILFCTTLLLTSCGSKEMKQESTNEKTEKVSKSDQKLAEKDAKVILDYIYAGKSSGIEKVTNQTKKELDDNLEKALADRQYSDFHGNINDYFLVADYETFSANEIIDGYASTYLKQAQKINNFTIQSVELSGDDATVNFELTPIAGSSEFNPIGNARTELFGGLDEDEFIRQSQNSDLTAIRKLMTMKLYEIYYNQMANKAELVSEPVEYSFQMTKKGNNYMVNNETMEELLKDSRATGYAE